MCSERGWIYVEATMNPKLQRLLTLTPGIIFRAPGHPVKFPVPCDDRPATLTIPADPADSLQVGNWARIIKGPYRGDLGLIAEVGEWIKLLVIPRLQSSYISRDLSKKRKRSGPTPPPAPMLFDPIQYEADRGVKLTQTGPHSFRYRTFSFEYGLLLKDFDCRAVSSQFVFMPFFLSSLLRLSDHPKIVEAIFPPPTGWEFFEGEDVDIVESPDLLAEKGHVKKKGTVKVVEAQRLEVELTNGEGSVCIPWDAARKRHKIGDFVQVSHGPHQGRFGWVLSASDHEISCAQELISPPGIENSEIVPWVEVRITVRQSNNLHTYPIKQEFSVHPNSAKSTEVPFHHSAKRPNIFHKLCPDHPQPEKSTPEDNVPLQVPWRGVAVVIVAHGEFKGRTGTVRDVHINRRTPSGLEVEVELDTFSGSNSFARKRLDYDHVAERRFAMFLPLFPPHLSDLNNYSCMIQLFDYRRPADERFYPLPRPRRFLGFRDLPVPGEISLPMPAWILESIGQFSGRTQMAAPGETSSSMQAWDLESISPSGGRTPMPAPGEIPSSSPAWDPSSSTPLGAGASSVLRNWSDCGLDRGTASANGPGASSSHPPPPPPPASTHILLDPRLENIKVSAKVTGAGHTNKAMTVWGTVIDGRRRIVYSSNKALKDITMAQVVLSVPNPTRTDSLLVVIDGENIGTFVRRVTHEKNGATSLAVCRVVTREKNCRDTVTATTLKLRAEDIALVAETKDEKALNQGILAEERAAVRIRR
jgi:ribosomal protein L24